MMINIYNLVQQQVTRSPEQIAITDYRKGHSRSCTYAELDEASAGAAAMFHQQGLRPGDRVLILQPMSIELYQLIAAIFRSGLVALFIDPSLDRESIQQFCQRQQPKAAVFASTAQALRVLIPSLREIPVKIAIGVPLPGDTRWNSSRYFSPRHEVLELPPESPALISLTSGSTGRPKGIIRSHGFLFNQHEILKKTLNHQAGDTCLVMLPLFVLSNLASGVTSLLPEAKFMKRKPADLTGMFTPLKHHKPDSAIGRPDFFQALTAAFNKRKVTFSELKQIFVGGDPVMPKLFDDLKTMAPEVQINAVYGATEAEPIATLTDIEATQQDFLATKQGKGILVGKPVDDIELRILPDQWGHPFGPFSRQAFEDQMLPSNQTGEIVISGSHVLTSYIEEQLNLLTKIDVEGTIWHRTGDAGYFDHRGHLWLTGRCITRNNE